VAGEPTWSLGQSEAQLGFYGGQKPASFDPNCLRVTVPLHAPSTQFVQDLVHELLALVHGHCREAGLKQPDDPARAGPLLVRHPAS
jgi:hypothetical protein